MMTFLKPFDVIKNNDIMKAFRYIILLAIISFLCACSTNEDGGNQQLNQFNSQICNGISGPTAVYWDSGHSLPTPLAQIPTIANPGQQFIHPQYPALGFIMPQGYVAQEITDQQTGTIGVNVFRNDNNVVWRYIPSSPFVGQIQINDVIAFELNQIMQFHGFNGTPDVICTTTQQTNEFGFPTTFGARLIRFGDFTASLIVQTHFMPSLGNTFISVTLATGPTAEYDNLVMETFLPLHWQLLVISDDVRDSDLDGTPDNQDAAPFNPNIQ
ncbi:hypothetical protein [Psychroserpens sp. SPM9]|uniref:hypothetical protein n=1 Tax=Psychroserpens sp. SPM9 TaxID=2975598 RepID=UPI0021A7036B|nr:hypothetical protein [Psychroserpens sp. SPM9]MDG5490347.1 hypothetical protein [Psychroserpens sp. SPM9]